MPQVPKWAAGITGAGGGASGRGGRGGRGGKREQAIEPEIGKSAAEDYNAVYNQDVASAWGRVKAHPKFSGIEKRFGVEGAFLDDEKYKACILVRWTIQIAG